MSEYETEPIGDKRRFYVLMHRREEMVWGGPEPDSAAPGTKSEEEKNNAALLEGTLEPRTEWERRFLEFMGGPHPKADRPKKWITCQICHAEVQVSGYPAGRAISMITADVERREIWLYPNRCQLCADRREARPAPPPAPFTVVERREPYKDE